MKKLLFLGAILCVTLKLNAQTQVGGSTSPIYISDQKVGIGLNIPQAQLSLGSWGVGNSGPSGGVQLRLGGEFNTGTNVYGKKLLIEGYDNDGSLTYPIYFMDENSNVDFWIRNRPAENGVPHMFFAGNIGIRTNNPIAPLHIVSGNQKYSAILAQADEESFQFYVKTLTSQPVNVETFRLGLKHQNDENNGFISFYRGGSSCGGFLGFSTFGQERVRIQSNGYVGIGTDTPDYLLDVAGTMRAKEIKVNLNDGPDYVFEDDYDLKSLDEVDQFIKDRKHLPGIPSAKQMEKDGVGLA
ncbi:hypothetical protein EYV94_28610, partial [Puteibacter caeruleilacunae]